MSTPPPTPPDDAPPPPPGDAPLSPAGGTPMQPAPQLQPMQMGGAPAKSGKGKLIGIIAGVLIIVGGLVFAGITYGPGLWAKYMGGGGDLNTPDGTIKYVLNGIANNKPEVVWEVLPASHQQTLNNELKKSMGNVDPEVHEQIFVVLKKLTGILKSKKTLIIEAVNSAAQESGAAPGSGMPPEVTENWDDGVGLLEIVVNSKLSDTAWVQNPDLGVLLKEDFGKIMASPVFDKLLDEMLKKENDFVPKTAADLRSAIKSIEVVVVSQTDETATLKLRSETLSPNDPESEEFKMVKVEERWLPEVVALGLDQVIGQLKQAVPMGSLADTGMNPQQKTVTMNFLKSVEGVLDAIDKQNTAGDMMQAAAGGISGLALQLEQLQSAFPNVGVAGSNPGGRPGAGGTAGIDPFTGLPIGGGRPGAGGAMAIDPVTGLSIGLGGGRPGGTGAFPGLPVGPPVSLGKRQRWTINGGKPAKRIDQIYLNKPATTIEAVFGVADSKEGAYWIYKDMTVRNIAGGGTMTKVYFGIQNGVVVDIQARP